jgi:hypothetical protein
MSYSISGSYLASCSCAAICGCPVDALPKDSEGGSECRGVAVFHVAEGSLDDVDLSGTDFAFYNLFPSNLTSGNWTVGVIVDSAASDDQAQALERILSGREGGPFGELAQFIGTYRGMERGSLGMAGGEKSSLTVNGHSEIQFEPNLGLDGSPTTVKNAMFGFAPEYTIGHTTGRSEAFGMTFEPAYGETAEFVFASEGAEPVRGRA